MPGPSLLQAGAPAEPALPGPCPGQPQCPASWALGQCADGPAQECHRPCSGPATPTLRDITLLQSTLIPNALAEQRARLLRGMPFDLPWTPAFPASSPLTNPPPSQVVFSLASGNIAGAFEIVTTNDSIGEVFVARPLDREELDHYILKVGTGPPRVTGDRPGERLTHQYALVVSQLPCCQQLPWGRQHLRATSMSAASVGEGVLGGAPEPEQEQQRRLSLP